MANRWARDRALPFYLGFGLVSLAAVMIGFSTTYAMPMYRRTFSAPPIVHLHGALATSWVLLFMIQTFLVRARQSRLHRRVGWLGVPIALGILVTGMGTAAWATQRDLPTVAVAATTMIGTLTSLLIFIAFVALAVVKRRTPDWHKRLMFLATVVVLWPAYFRFRHLLPAVPRPEILLALLLADLPILVAALRDKLLYGRVHPVWLWFGSALFIEQCFEIAIFETRLWNSLGLTLYEALT